MHFKNKKSTIVSILFNLGHSLGCKGFTFNDEIKKKCSNIENGTMLLIYEEGNK